MLLLRKSEKKNKKRQLLIVCGLTSMSSSHDTKITILYESGPPSWLSDRNPDHIYHHLFGPPSINLTKEIKRVLNINLPDQTRYIMHMM